MIGKLCKNRNAFIYLLLLYIRCISIWLKGIRKALVTLKFAMSPILKACWSRTHSTIIIALCCDFIAVWDIKRSTLKPISIKKVSIANVNYITFEYVLVVYDYQNASYLQ